MKKNSNGRRAKAMGMDRLPCKFAGCMRSRQGGGRGYCAAHYAQLRRGKPLTPIREQGLPKVRLGGLSVPLEVANALSRKGPTLHGAATTVLVEWARRNGSKRKT